MQVKCSGRITNQQKVLWHLKIQVQVRQAL